MTERAVADVAGDNAAAEELRSYIERIESRDEVIADANDDKKDIYAEAESRGYDKKAIKQLVALRRKDPAERQATEAILETYKAALGMV